MKWTLGSYILFKPFIMEINKILTADILDIIFEGKNKEYGAYELRKTYNSRIVKAIVGTGIVVLLVFIWYFVSNLDSGKEKKALVVQDVQLEEKKTKCGHRQAGTYPGKKGPFVRSVVCVISDH